MPAQFTCPLVTVIPGQLIASSLWNGEFNNISTNFIPAGMDSYSDTDAQMQIQTAPFPGSVTSHAANLGGEIERIRYQLSLLSGETYWYIAPEISLSNAHDKIVPVGGVIDYPTGTAPSGSWHLADGTAISRSTYSVLFTLIGTTFGAGDASTTFNLPDYRDRMSIGAGTTYAAAATGGEATHTLVTAEIPSVTVTDPGHIHTITDPGHAHSEQYATLGGATPTIVSTNASTGGTNGAGINTGSSTTGISINSHTTGITVAGGGGAHNNLPPYLGMYRMIRII